MEEDRLADAALLKRAVDGDRRACRELVDNHLRHVNGLAFRMLGNAADAEEVAQETFLRLWTRAGKWRPDARLRTWLYRVAHNLCVDKLRRRKWTSESTPPDSIDPGPGPAEHFHKAELAAIVSAEIQLLPERQRTAVTLVHQLEIGNKEAAAIMGVSVKAVESLLSRGRSTLRTRLAPVCADLIANPKGTRKLRDV